MIFRALLRDYVIVGKFEIQFIKKGNELFNGPVKIKLDD